MKMYIDTHCHLSKEDYLDVDKVIQENREQNVSMIVVSACKKEDFKEALEYAKKYEDVYVTLGYHPEEVEDVDDEDLLYLKEHLKEKKIVGVGEIGLDYYYDKSKKKEQIELFEKQLRLAEEENLPVVIHSRDATQDTIDTLKKYKVKGVIHCFSGKKEVADIYIKMGFALGIGGIVTFKNSNLGSVIKDLPLSSFVLETDSPYLSPVPYRGKQNSSKNIPIIAEKIGELKEISTSLVEKVTTENAMKIFDFEHKK